MGFSLNRVNSPSFPQFFRFVISFIKLKQNERKGTIETEEEEKYFLSFIIFQEKQET